MRADASSDLLNQRLWFDWLGEVRIEPGHAAARSCARCIENGDRDSKTATSS
jgi:hypothetical protein